MKVFQPTKQLTNSTARPFGIAPWHVAATIRNSCQERMDHDGSTKQISGQI